jgi:hypothetical protein
MLPGVAAIVFATGAATIIINGVNREDEPPESRVVLSRDVWGILGIEGCVAHHRAPFWATGSPPVVFLLGGGSGGGLINRTRQSAFHFS